MERVPVRKPTAIGSMHLKTQRLTLHVLPKSKSDLWNKTIPMIRHQVREVFRANNHKVRVQVAVFQAQPDNDKAMMNKTRNFTNDDGDEKQKETAPKKKSRSVHGTTTQYIAVHHSTRHHIAVHHTIPNHPDHNAADHNAAPPKSKQVRWK